MEVNAFKLERLLSLTSKISSVTCSCDTGSDILVGTSDGKLVWFSEGKAEDDDMPPEYREVTSFIVSGRGKAVEQIEAVADLRRVVVLCDGQVTLHDLSSLERAPSGISLKATALAFCLNQKGPPLYRLCVTVKRKLLLYEYARGQYNFLKDLALPDTPVSVSWYGKSICIAYKREYNLVNADTGIVKDMAVPLDSRSKPLVVSLPSGDSLLTGVEGVGVFMDAHGHTIPRGTLTWDDAPSSVVYRFPYIASLIAKSRVEVHNEGDARRVQTIAFPRGQSLYATPWFDGGGMLLAIGSDRAVYRLTPRPVEEQVASLLDGGAVKEAFELLQRTKAVSDSATLARFHLQAGTIQFMALDFADSVAHFKQALLDPRELLQFFPALQPAGFSYAASKLRATELPPILQDMDSVDVEQLISSQLPTRLAKSLGGDGESYRAEAYAALQELLEFWRPKAELTDVALQAAVDTALLRLYATAAIASTAGGGGGGGGGGGAGGAGGGAAARDADARLTALLSGSNAVDVVEGSSFLADCRLFHAQALFALSKAQPRRALEIWQQLGAGELTDGSAGSDSVRDGVADTVACLRACTERELVWVFSSWVLRRSPSDGMAIFTQRSEGAPLDAMRVLEHLSSFHELGPQLRLMYLEHIVLQEKREEPRFHTLLAQQLVDVVLQLAERKGVDLRSSEPGSEEGRLGELRAELLTLLNSSVLYDVTALLARLKGTALHHELVQLHGKTESHSEALHTLVFHLRDRKAAEAYCLKHVDPDDATHERSLFLLLLRLYLYPEGDVPPMMDAAMDLLSRHAASINPVKVLEILPESTPLMDLTAYLSAIIPHTTSKYREGQVVKNLSKIENLEVKSRLIGLRSRSHDISKRTRCPVCTKPIGDMVPVAFPNGIVVHYMCTGGKLDVCPVTHEHFPREDVLHLL